MTTEETKPQKTPAVTETQRKWLGTAKLVTTMHLNLGDAGVLIQECKAKGIGRTVRTPKVKGAWGVGVVSWHDLEEDVKDGEFTQYDSLHDLLNAKGIE